ncbi:DUF6544 family protein [uncultured Draconibacterium sp.]|uniref:DUF6920 family protein n=1 Tax=uncultured Draconibacterium sp. TaxID=1573823 RepID=UPI0025E4645D|nr:DUF6544 family protein [uncultured Draconibacterium sp.]
MRKLCIILITLHGLIHLIGFIQTFKITDFKMLNHPISKVIGIMWLLGVLLFILVSVMYILKSEFWWLAGFIAIFISQILIILFWQEAKLGIIPNIIILLACIVACSNFYFNQKVNEELSQLFIEAKYAASPSRNIQELPLPVQRWYNSSGFLSSENEIIKNVYLKQEVLMKTKPQQEIWYKGHAVQYFNIQQPAFNWSVALDMNPLIKVVGRDKFENGKGEMLIKLYSIFPVVNVKDNDKINQAALQRYLAEIVWFPAAALSRYITWESIDNYSARATMTFNGTTGSGIFYFNENWEFVRFSAMRYKDTDENAQLKEWIAEVIESKVINGIKIPVEMKVTWKLKDTEWTWLKLKISEIQYNVEEMPVANILYK